MLADLRDGWREFIGRPWLWSIVVAFSIANAVVGAADAVYGPLVARDSLGGAGPWGLALAAFGSGRGGTIDATGWTVQSDDINLAGAHGILVNVTAGMDLSIGEFQEVGNIVKQFASEDATVVVGTVIDPELSNMVRVTVVATGLGRPAAAVRGPCRRRA